MIFIPLVLRAALVALALVTHRASARAQDLPGNPLADQLHVQGRLIGRELYDRTGEQIGTVEAVRMAPNGMVVGVGVDIGSFLGIGPRRISVPAVQLDSVENRLTARDLTRHAAESLPAE
jgi:hypothetical protein